MDQSTGPASLPAFRDAVLKGIEPPPAPTLARLPYYRWLVVGAVCIGAFMGQVDSSIAQLLLPRLEADFGARLSAVSWVAVAYLVTMAGFLPIFGRLADMVGRKLLYTGGFLLFVIGSGLCGFASSLPTLIVFRVVQAIGAALLSANSVAIVVTAAVSHIPPSLVEQLKPGGRMIIPVGSRFMVQQLVLVEKDREGTVVTRQLLPVRFVPLTGSH